MRKEDLSRYMSVKRTAYCIFLLENPQISNLGTGKDCSFEKQRLLEGLSETEKQIFVDTLTFPYDLALFKELCKKSSLANVEATLKNFSIDKQLYERKWHEYAVHSYGSLVEGSIDIKFSDFSLKLEEMWLDLQCQKHSTSENQQKK